MLFVNEYFGGIVMLWCDDESVMCFIYDCDWKRVVCFGEVFNFELCSRYCSGDSDYFYEGWCGCGIDVFLNL